MKHKTTFLLICVLASAILRIQGAKGEDEDYSAVENNEKDVTANKDDRHKEKPVTTDKDAQIVNESDDTSEAVIRGDSSDDLSKDPGAENEDAKTNKNRSKMFFENNKILICEHDKEMADVEASSEKRNEEEYKNGYLLDLKTDQLFKVIDNLEDQFKSVRRQYQDAAKAEKLDSTMLEALLKFRGVGQTALHNAWGIPCNVPAGLQVGSYLVHSDDVSLYFIHRMKVRNSTVFRVNSLHNNLYNMALHVELDLNDLQITGSYEQLHAVKGHYRFLYRPTFGIIDIVLTNVKYKVEGRYRLVEGRLYIEHVISELRPKDFIVQLSNAEKNPVKIFDTDTIVRRIQVHLDHWMKDYFNDYLMFFGVARKSKNADLLKYDQEKSLTLNEWMDQAINLLKAKMRQTDSTALHLKIYPLKIFAPDGMRIDVGPMVVRDIDSLHRRSVTTISAENKGGVRQVDAILGFGHLEVEGKYTMYIRSGHPPLEATFAITLDGLTTHLSIVAKRGAKVPYLHFRTLEPTRTEFTTVEGSSTRDLAVYKHIFETYIIALASDRLINIVENLGDFRKRNNFHQIRHMDPGQIREKKNTEKTDDQHEPTDREGLMFCIKHGDSVEVEIPEDNGKPAKKLHINFSDLFKIKTA